VLQQIIERETERLLSGVLPWAWWLERAARYGQYGFGPTLLIAAQSRFATDVRSYDAWLVAGRQVRKGEQGIRILSRQGRPRAVFDISQTTGLPPPVADAPRLREVLIQQGGRPDRHDSSAMLCHRLAHLLLYHPDCSGVRRVEADSVAFLVLARLGLEVSGLGFPPVTTWAAETPINTVGDRVLRAASRIQELLGALPAVAELSAMHTAAHTFFRERLAESWVPEYLTARGFGPEVQARWGIGYSPANGHALTNHLRGLGHHDDAIALAGLARRGRKGTLRDMFRDRLMLPIRDPRGGVAGFIGRLQEGSDGPKYLNTPETPIFHKGALLFGLHETRESLAAGARPVLVEGPLDAIAAGLAGHAAVAPCGTQLSAAQIRALGEVADLDHTGLLVALDGDTAGRRAAVRAWDTLAHISGPLDAVVFPSGQDPADLLRAGGPTAVAAALATGTPLADLVVDARMRPASVRLDFDEQRWAAAGAAADIIARLPPEQIARQVLRVADRLAIDPAIVTLAVAAAISPIPADE
jgi:DNA primase